MGLNNVLQLATYGKIRTMEYGQYKSAIAIVITIMYVPEPLDLHVAWNPLILYRYIRWLFANNKDKS